MLKTINNLLETFLGFVVLIIAGVFVYFVHNAGQSGGSIHGHTLIANFERIDGLNVGSDVKMSGVKIGHVQALEIDPVTYQAKAYIYVNADLKIPADSSAEISSDGLLGGKYIALVPGADEVLLGDQGIIAETQSSVSFESLLNKFLMSQGSGDSKEKAHPAPAHKSEPKKVHPAPVAEHPAVAAEKSHKDSAPRAESTHHSAKAADGDKKPTDKKQDHKQDAAAKKHEKTGDVKPENKHDNKDASLFSAPKKENKPKDAHVDAKNAHHDGMKPQKKETSHFVEKIKEVHQAVKPADKQKQKQKHDVKKPVKKKAISVSKAIAVDDNDDDDDADSDDGDDNDGQRNTDDDDDIGAENANVKKKSVG